jgi:hypothetical protein
MTNSRQNHFRSLYQKKDDAWLIQAWKERANFEPEAHEPLKEELERRGLGTEETAATQLQEAHDGLGNPPDFPLSISQPDFKEMDLSHLISAQQPFSILGGLEVPQRKRKTWLIWVAIPVAILNTIRLVLSGGESALVLAVFIWGIAILLAVLSFTLKSSRAKRSLVLINALRPGMALGVHGGKELIQVAFPMRYRFFYERHPTDVAPYFATSGIVKHFVAENANGKLALHLFMPLAKDDPKWLEGWEEWKGKQITYQGDRQFCVSVDKGIKLDVLREILRRLEAARETAS